VNLRQVKSDYNIVDYLRFAGASTAESTNGWRAVKCPWHGDKSASASYNTGLNRFRCHACEIGGDLIDVVMQTQNITDYGQVVEWIQRTLPRRR